MTSSLQPDLTIPRRHFFQSGVMGLGTAALASLLNDNAQADISSAPKYQPALESFHFTPRAKNTIYIFQAGGAAQMELYDHKPHLEKYQGQDLPKSVMGDQRLTGFTSGQSSFPVAASPFRFRRHGECGAKISELLPEFAKQADDVCFIHSMHTEAVNHDPALTLMMTGHQQPGRPSIGAWLSYGLGSENQNLPAFVVLITPGLIPDAATPISARHWGSGFLPSQHQGVKFRSGKDPVLYLNNPPGIDMATRRRMLDVAAQFNRRQFDRLGDPEIQTRIAQYELAFRMQTSVPELTNLSGEPPHVLNSYGPLVNEPGSYASNCLLARRLIEKGVRFVQIFDRDWDHHRNCPVHLRTKGQLTDQPTAALLRDLKQRGMLEDTLVVCAGEFGRTVYTQGSFQKDYGRDHHGGCFSIWLAGAGVKQGFSLGRTDEFSFNITESPVHVHDLNATLMHLLGIDHERLTYFAQGRRYRLTDVHGEVVQDILA